MHAIAAHDILARQQVAEKSFLDSAIMFTVKSGSNRGIDRIFNFDIIPRVMDASEWIRIERGLKQRIFLR